MDTNYILNADIKGLSIEKLFKTDTTENILICLEKGHQFPKHTSPKDAFLLVLQGQIIFHIDNKTITLGKQQLYSFPKYTEHYVTAVENAKFLIVR